MMIQSPLDFFVPQSPAAIADLSTNMDVFIAFCKGIH